MKTHLSKKALWQSLLSVITSGIFILLAVGSIGVLFLPKSKMECLGNGIYKETVFSLSRTSKIITGARDDKGRWNGKVTIEYTGKDKYTEEAHMAYGMRQGISTYTYPDGHKEEVYYMNDQIVDSPTKAAHADMEDISAFQILGNKYLWFLFSLNACGFEDTYVEAFMDTVETLLGAYEFDATEFDNYYEDVMSGLEETPYDSIIVLNSNLFLIQGMEFIKNSELRLAVIDRYRSEGSSTYDVVNTTYPGYLLSLNDSGIVNQDFETFCNDLDDTLASYGPLDPQDPFFVDSIDSRLFTALFSIMSAKKSSSSLANLPVKSAALKNEMGDVRDIYHELKAIINPPSLKLSSAEVASLVVSAMLIDFIKGDILRRAVREAWSIKKGVISLPTMATAFVSNNSATSVTLQGYIIEDGGGVVTSRGITWATFHNPTKSDNPVASGTGTGNFSVTVNGLTEGTTYYARTYATNSAGTAYGNCIRFVAAIPTGINDVKIFNRDFSIYPNPASSFATLSFHLGSSENIMLTILDMKGQVVLYHDLGHRLQGENQIKMNLSGLRNGMYTCQLTNGNVKVTRKLVIAH